jgi:hypothetical protein
MADGGIGRRSSRRSPPWRSAIAPAAASETRPPAQTPRHRRKALLEHAARSRLGAEMVDQDPALQVDNARDRCRRPQTSARTTCYWVRLWPGLAIDRTPNSAAPH